MNRRTAYLLVALPLATLIALLNVRAHCPGNLRTTIAQLQFLSGSLDRGAANQMQRVFPEGLVFTWALYGLASAQAAGQLDSDDPRREQLLQEAHRAVRNVESDEARVTFSANLDPPFGVFYTAWSLYVRATLVRAAGPIELGPEFLGRFEDDCKDFAGALARSESPFLSSYPASVWPADTAVGIAALGIHDKVLSPRFASEISRWAADVRTRLDHELGAIAHAARARTGAPMGGVRGSSLALMSRVLIDADPELARAQYAILRQQFVDFRWGIPGVREFPHGHEGRGDIDSGPLLLGYSGPAVVVGAAAARVHGDTALARVLLSAVEVGGLPVQLGGERRYLAGVVPVGDAFIAWARSGRSRVKDVEWKALIPKWWVVPAHLISALGVFLLLLPPVRWLMSDRSHRRPAA